MDRTGFTLLQQSRYRSAVPGERLSPQRLKTLGTPLASEWLQFELWSWGGVHNGLTHHVFQAFDRLGDKLNVDPMWRQWWSQTSKAPELWVGFTVYWPAKISPSELQEWMPTRVARGRRRHFVRLHVDAARLEALRKEDRHTLAASLLAQALDWLIAELRLNPRPELPEGPPTASASGHGGV